VELAPAELPTSAAEGGALPSQQQPAAAAAAAAAAGGGVGPGAAPVSERDWLIADKQQVLYDELMAMGVMRQELVDILADMGQQAAEDEALVRGRGKGGGRGGRKEGGGGWREGGEREGGFRMVLGEVAY